MTSKTPFYLVALSSKSLYSEISTPPSFLTQMAHLRANTLVKPTDTPYLTLAVDSTAQKTMFWPCALSQFSIFPHQAAIIVGQHPSYITPAHPVNFHNMAPTALLTFLHYSIAPNEYLSSNALCLNSILSIATLPPGSPTCCLPLHMSRNLAKFREQHPPRPPTPHTPHCNEA